MMSHDSTKALHRLYRRTHRSDAMTNVPSPSYWPTTWAGEHPQRAARVAGYAPWGAVVGGYAAYVRVDDVSAFERAGHDVTAPTP